MTGNEVKIIMINQTAIITYDSTLYRRGPSSLFKRILGVLFRVQLDTSNFYPIFMQCVQGPTRVLRIFLT